LFYAGCEIKARFTRQLPGRTTSGAACVFTNTTPLQYERRPEQPPINSFVGTVPLDPHTTPN